MYRVRREWTIREIDLAPELLTSRYGLLRWFALSLGLINENDKREGIIVVLDALFTYWFGKGRDPTFEEIKHHISRRYLEKGERPPTDEALRHHLRRLIRIGFIERVEGKYKLLTTPNRPDEPESAIETIFDRINEVKNLIKTGFSHLKNLYS